MKNYFIYLLSLIPMLSIAQSRVITGIVKDVDTKKPIEAASLSIVGTNQRTLTNEEGEFKISVPQENSQLNFYHLSYADENYKVKETANVEILMTPKVYQLEEVVIGKESGLDSLYLAVNVSKKKLEKSLLLHTYYRELSRYEMKFNGKEDKLTSFADGILDYHLHKKTVGKKNKMREVNASDLYVKQSRVKNDFSEVEGDNLNQSVQDINNIVLKAYNFEAVRKITENSSTYDFRVVTKTDSGGNRIKVVNISPKEGLEEEMLYIGSVTYDSKTNLILDIDLKYSPEHKKYHVVHSFWFIYSFKFKFIEDDRKSVFKIDGDQYVMLYHQNRENFYMKIGKKLEGSFEYVHDITTLDYKEGIFDLDETKKYVKKTLGENGNNYTENFWEKQNVVPLSDKEENIIREINQKSATSNTNSALN